MYNSQKIFQNYKEALSTRNYKDVENILIQKQNSDTNSNSKDYIESAIENQQNSEHKIFWLFQQFNVANASQKLECLKNIIFFINKSSDVFLNILANEQDNNQQFEFQKLFKYIHMSIKDIINKNDRRSINQKTLEDLLSNMRTTFGQLKNNECWNSLLYILNIVFYIYFYINQFHACTYLLKMISDYEKQLLKNSEQDQKFYYYYYTARIQHFEGDIDQVEQRLEKALKFCKSFENQKIILQLLIPCKINLYAFPKEDLLQRFQLQEFKELSIAIQNGDIKKFEQSMQQNMINWIQQGIYFFLGESKSICQRNFIKNFYVAQNNKIQIELKLLLFCYNKFSLNQIDINHLIGMLSGLISKEYIKGQIVLDQQLLILSSKNAFPHLEYEELE